MQRLQCVPEAGLAKNVEYTEKVIFLGGRKYGRKKTMLLAGLLFDVGVIITASAFNLPTLIIGRILLGIAVAFASVAVTLYNSEMAPAHIRGRLNQIFQVRPKCGCLFLRLNQISSRVWYQSQKAC